MIQDIGNHKYHNEYQQKKPTAGDRILCYRKRELLASSEEGSLSFVTYKELEKTCPQAAQQLIYLFAIDDTAYFLAQEALVREQVEDGRLAGFSWQPIELFRRTEPKDAAFAGITGYQLSEWYASRRFCPRCGSRMVHDEKERMMRCPDCGLTEYPKICPAVIVGVTKGDKIVLTKYAGRSFKNYALIAGFAETGESIEQTVEREVLEEVGLRVKNIRYYKSQPWSLSSTLLMGFFCDVDGSDEIRLDEEELSVGEWCTADQVPGDDGISLTREMMQAFKDGKHLAEDRGSKVQTRHLA